MTYSLSAILIIPYVSRAPKTAVGMKSEISKQSLVDLLNSYTKQWNSYIVWNIITLYVCYKIIIMSNINEYLSNVNDVVSFILTCWPSCHTSRQRRLIGAFS